MNDAGVARLFCVAAPALAGMSHVAMFAGWPPLPYPVLGAAAAGCGLAGLVVGSSVNRKRPGDVATAYSILAVLGVLGGLFYATVIGPFILFFPKI